MLDRWRVIAGGDQPHIFAHRLAMDHLDEAHVAQRLGPVRRRDGAEEPQWLSDSQAIVRDLMEGDRASDDAEASVIAFGPLLSPLVASAIREIERDHNWAALLSLQARKSAARQLWQSLGELFSMPLFEIFSSWRASQAAGTRDFDFFVAHMRREGFAELFRRYPVIARVAGTLRRHWLSSYGQFFDRLSADAALLASEFKKAAPLIISDLRYGLSDPHGAGEVVLELCLSDGSSLFYKPRSLASDMVVKDFIACLTALDPVLDLRIAHFLDRGSYGWTEGVKISPSADRAAVGRYYRRAGAWLACFHLLNASDMHMENILACGEYPIPIDFETILQALSTPPQDPKLGESAHWLASQMLEESVLAVGLLPGYIRADDGRTISVGGLEASLFEVKRLEWSNLNNFDMSVRLTRQSQVIDTNLPSLGVEKIPIDAFREDIVKGMRQALQTASQRSSEVRAFFESLRGRGLKVRRVIRPTRFYYLLLRRLCDHRAMTDGVTWSMQSELIARLYNWDDMSMQPWKLFRQERADLCRMTIPAFYLEAHRTVACSWEGTVTNLHARDGLAVAIERIDRLDADAVERQCRFAETALGMTPSSSSSRHSVRSGDLVTGICEHLDELALQDDRSAAWLGLEYLDHRMTSQVVPIGHDLYNGNVGIALFLAAAGRSRRDAKALDLARRAIAPVLGALASDNRHRLIRTMGCGGFIGVGSLVYGLTVMSDLLPDGEGMLAGAKAAARMLSVEAIGADDRLDLVSGHAGALLAVLKLYRSTGDDVLLAQALAIGEALAKRTRPAGMPWTSPVFDNEPLTGISHGASGFALAFARLGKEAGVSRFDEIVAECLAFERSKFDEVANNWADTRPASMRIGTRSPNQWCYGAAGIGFTRLALGDLVGATDAAMGAEIRSAVRSVLDLGPHSNDTLCCGIAGHADFLLAAAERLDDFEAAQGARERINEIARRWRDRGDVRWDQGSKDFNLGLMRGLAGIGYAALRSEDATLPRVLILD